MTTLQRVARSIYEYSLQKMYEIAVEKMIERGFEATNVKKIGGKITFEVEKDELFKNSKKKYSFFMLKTQQT